MSHLKWEGKKYRTEHECEIQQKGLWDLNLSDSLSSEETRIMSGTSVICQRFMNILLRVSS